MIDKKIEKQTILSIWTQKGYFKTLIKIGDFMYDNRQTNWRDLKEVFDLLLTIVS